MAVSEEFTLDVSDALAAVDALDAHISATADSARQALSDAFTSAAGDAQALGELAGEAISSGIADGTATGLAALQDGISGLSSTVQVGVDTSGLQGLETDLPTVEIPVDRSQIDAATQDLQTLAQDAVGPSEPVEVPVDTAQIETALTDVEALQAAAAGSTDGLAIAPDSSGVSGAVDDLEALRAAEQGAGESVTVRVDDNQVSGAVADIENLQQQAAEPAVVRVETDQSGLGSIQSPADASQTVTVDTTGVDAAQADLAALRDAEEATSPTVTVPVDDSQVTDAVGALDGLQARQDGVEVPVTVDSSAVPDAETALNNLGAAEDRAAGGVTIPVDDTAVVSAEQDVTGLTAAVDAAGRTVEIGADTTGIEDARQQLDGLSDTPADVTVPVDTSGIDTAEAGLADLRASAEDSPETVVVVDDSQVPGAEAQLGDLAAAENEASRDVTITVEDSEVKSAEQDLVELADAAQTAETTVVVGADTSQIQDAADQVAGLGDGSSTTTIQVDDTEVTAAQQDLADLSAAENTADQTVTVGVDDSDVETTVTDLDTLHTAADQNTTTVVMVDDSAVVDATAGIQGLSDGIQGLTGGATISVDDSEVEAALSLFSDLDAAEQSASGDITITVGDEELVSAISLLGDLNQAESEASQNDVEVSVDASGVESASGGLDSFSGSATQAGGSAAAAEVGVGGLLGKLSSVSPESIAAAGSVAALGFGLEEYVKLGTQAEQGTDRLSRAYGDNAAAVQKIQVGGLNTNLRDLTLSTGGVVGAVQIAVANLGELGKATGATSSQTLEAGQNFGALTNYIAATRPELGNAEDIAGRLGRALQTGGRFALALGLPLNSSGEIAQAASQKFGVATDQLTSFEKQSAAMDLVLQRLGPDFKKNLSDALDTPTVKIKAVEGALKDAIAASGEKLTPAFVSGLQDAQPVVEGLVKSLGNLGTGAVSTLAVEGKGLGEVLNGIAKILNSDVGSALVTAGGGALVFSKTLDGLGAVATRLAPLLAKVASGLGFEGVADRFNLIAGGAAAAEVQMGRFEAATVTNAQAQASLQAGIEGVDATTAEGVAVQDAYLESLTAQQSVTDAITAKIATETTLREARTAVISGEVGATDELTAALVADASAAEAVTAAEAEAVVTTEALAAAITAAETAEVAGAAGLGELAVSAESAGAAQTAAAAEIGSTTPLVSGLSAAILPLTIAVGGGIAAWQAYERAQSDAKASIKSAQSTVDEYRSSLNLTGQQLAALDPTAASQKFSQSKTILEQFDQALTARGVDKNVFDQAGISATQLSAALTGTQAQLNATLDQLDKAGQKGPQALDRLKSGIVGALGEASGFGGDTARTITGAEGVTNESGESGASQAVIAQRKALQDLQDSELKAAQASLDRGKITDATAVEDGLADGALSKLTATQRAQLGVMLEAVDKQNQELTQNAELAASVQALGLTYGPLLTSATAAYTSITTLLPPAAAGADASKASFDALSASQQEVITSGVASARSIQDNGEAFGKLTTDQQSAITSTIQYADQARQAAQANNDLLTSTGELGADYDSLGSALDAAADKWNTLSEAEAKVVTDERDLRTGVRDLAGDVQDLGTNLDDQNASFDGASVTLDNYQTALALLPQATQDAINAIGQGGAAADKSANKINAVQQALTNLHAQGQDPVQGLIDVNTKVTATNVDDVLKALPQSIQEQIKLNVDDSSVQTSQSKAQVDAEKAAATQKAVLEATGSTAAKLNVQAADNAAKLAGDVQTQFANIRNLGVDQLKAIDPTDPDASSKIQQVENSTNLLSTALENQAIKLGLNKQQVEDLRSAEGLLPSQVSQNFASSGLDKVSADLKTLEVILLAITNPSIQPSLNAALAITDPIAQAQAFQKIINSIGPDGQAAVHQALGTGNTDAVKAFGDDVSTQLQAAVKGGLDFSTAETALKEINDFNANPLNPKKVTVTADTIQAVAQIDEAAKGRVSDITATDPTDSAGKAKASLDDAAKNRQSLLTVDADTDPANAKIDALSAKIKAGLATFDPTKAITDQSLGGLGFGKSTEPKKADGTAKVTVDADTAPAEAATKSFTDKKRSATPITVDADTKPADKSLTEETQKKRTTVLGVQLNVDDSAIAGLANKVKIAIGLAFASSGLTVTPTTASPPTFTTPPSPGSSASTRLNRPTTGGFSQGGHIPAGVHGYSDGSQQDLIDEAVRRHQDLGYTSDLTPGKYNAGAYAVVGENDSAGEYVVSQRPDQREENVQILGEAANSFGFSLVPAGAGGEGGGAQAQQVLVAPQQQDPELASAISSLAGAARQGWSAPTINANLYEQDPAESLNEIYGRLDEMRFLGN